MTDLNQVALIGRLTKDAEIGYTKTGAAKASMTVAVNRSKKNGDKWENEAYFFDIQLWGAQAEALSSFLKKGKQVAVKGYLQQQRWEKDGQKFSRVVINADSCQLIGGNGNGGNKAESVPGTNQNTDSEDFPEDVLF